MYFISKMGGVSHARNCGLEAAHGDIVCFIDSDDWVEPNYLSSMLRYSLDDDTLVFGGIVHDWNGGESYTEFSFEEGETYYDFLPSDFVARNRILGHGYPVAKFFRKRIIDRYKLRFDERISFHEDHLFFWQYLSHVKRITLTAVAAYHYVHQENGLSLSGKKHPVKSMVMMSDLLIPVWEGLIHQFHIQDEAYVKSICTEQCLRPLTVAARMVTTENYDVVCEAFKRRMGLFRKYYRPVHTYARIVPFLFRIGLGRVLVWRNMLK